MVDKSYPLLLVDLGYALFYRYSASQLWYKHSHPEEKADLSKDYKWHQNVEFVEKMKKMFMVDIFTLAKDYKVPKSNIIIAEDCRLKDNWRSKEFDDYKAQRNEEREKTGWQGAGSFEIIYNEVLPEMVNTHGVIHLKSPNVEADDIISQLVIKYKSQFPSFVIVASDNDYFQILNDGVDLITMKGVSVKDKMKYSPEFHLLEKILKGDVSDNIQACEFNKELIMEVIPEMKPKTKTKPKTKLTSETETEIVKVKANKKILDYYMSQSDPKQIENDIARMGNNFVFGYKENKKLIDFNELPEEYVKNIHTLVDTLFK
jgi:5'-3' exonuclease